MWRTHGVPGTRTTPQRIIERRGHPIRKIFERGCEPGLWSMTGERIWRAFGRGHRDRIKGKLQTIMERIEHGQHVFRAYWKHAWIKQYEKYATYLRNEVTSNNLRDFKLRDFKLRKELAHLGVVRTRLLQVLDRFAGQQAENLNVHEDFALLRRTALPVENGRVRTAGIRIQDARMIRLLEVLPHAGASIGGWSTKQIHAGILERFSLNTRLYDIGSLRYDLRKLKGHGLIEREPGRDAWRLNGKGQRVAILFLLFHQRLCGPLAGSQFHHQPEQSHRPKQSKLEQACYKADHAIDEIVSLLRAA